MIKFSAVTNAMRIEALTNPLGHNQEPGYFTLTGKPSCFVGKALDRIGLTFDQFSPMLNGCAVNAINWTLFGIENPNTYQKMWAGIAQSAADAGDSYILALAKADAHPI